MWIGLALQTSGNIYIKTTSVQHHLSLAAIPSQHLWLAHFSSCVWWPVMERPRGGRSRQLTIPCRTWGWSQTAGCSTPQASASHYYTVARGRDLGWKCWCRISSAFAAFSLLLKWVFVHRVVMTVQTMVWCRDDCTRAPHQLQIHWLIRHSSPSLTWSRHWQF